MTATSPTPGSTAAERHAPAASRPAGPAAARGAGRALLMRLHFYIGIFIGPFLLIAAVSGAAYALSPQLERVLYAQALTGTVAEQPLSLDQQVAAAQAATGVESSPAALRPAEDGGTTRVMFAQPHLGPSEHRGVFVDPGTGEVVGDMTVYGTSGSLPFRTAIDQLHRSLLLGEPGRLYSELAASWLWVGALSEATAADGTSAQGAEAAGGEHVQHGAAGEHDHGGSGVAASPSGVSYDRVLAAARSADLEAQKIEIVPGQGPATAWTVSEVDRSWPTQVDAAAVDPADAEVVDVVRFSDYGVMAKLARWGIDAHMGVLFGVVNQIVMAALALALAAMIVWGYVMWWRRRPTRHRHEAGFPTGPRPPGFGRTPARGALRRVPPAGALVLGAVVVGVALFLPVLGVSLLAFLALDVLLGLRGRGTRSARRADAPP